MFEILIFILNAEFIGSSLTDDLGNILEAFPDEAIISAKKYCRNPTMNPNGSWCYINQRKSTSEFCNIPFCKNFGCRITDTKNEYVGLMWPMTTPLECIFQNLNPFNGTLSMTQKGHNCISWTNSYSVPVQYQNKTYSGKEACQKFCRNLDNNLDGASCIIRSLDGNRSFTKEYCYPCPGSIEDRKILETVKDHVSKLNFTRSKRQCKMSAVNESNKANISDSSLQNVSIVCRSLNKIWCYSADPEAPKDQCYTEDCNKSLKCFVLTNKIINGTFMYILPRWRTFGLEFWVKAWNPDVYEGLIFSLLSINHSREYTLLIGCDENEKVKLLYKSANTETLLEHKTLPHLISAGKWTGYWLRTGFGKIELGYKGVSLPLFKWTSVKEELSFEPMFLNFGTIKNYWMGINFHCNECLVETSSIEQGNKIYPINLKTRNENFNCCLTLNIRGTGSALIYLMWTPDFNKSIVITLESNENISVIQNSRSDTEKLDLLASFSVLDGIKKNKWSEYVISFSEYGLDINKDNYRVVSWSSPFSLLFYWFSVSARGGDVIWSANCPPVDIDGQPRDGNWGDWGPWSCSVTCGGGEGRVERKCDNPPPNVFGRECIGSSTYEGPCNDFPCGEITPGTYNLIRNYLSQQYKSLKVNAKDKVSLACNPEGIKLVSAEVAYMNIKWTLNGIPCSRTKFRIDENYTLTIPHAQEKHNGIYLCTIYQSPDTLPPKVVLEAVSLVVMKNRPNKKVRKGGILTLKCNGLALSTVYTDLSQRWELNGTVWKDYGVGALETIAIDKLENLDDSHSGVWTCVIFQENLKFKWVTNWILLKVKSAPSFWSHLMEDVATAPIFGKLGNERNTMVVFFSLVGIFILLLVLVISILVKVARK